MNWLLKIVDGPMKGAEIALVTGTRVKLGSGEACDIVVADASLADEAFELDVTEEAVTLTAPGCEAVVMRPYEVRAFGTTGIAVGSGEGVWPALVYPTPEPPGESDEAVPEPASAEPEAEPAAAEAAAAAAAEPPPRRRRGCGLGCLVMLLLFLLLLGCAYWLLRYRPELVRENCPETLKAHVPETVRTCLAKVMASCASAAEPAAAPVGVTAVDPFTALGRLAGEHALTLAKTNGVPLLAGNLLRRTERLAIRALAVAADRRTKFDLTDDETLKESAETLLFTVSEGALRVVTATNRVLRLAGEVGDPALVARSLKALREDIPYVRSVSTEAVALPGSRVSGADRPAEAAPASEGGAVGTAGGADAVSAEARKPKAKRPELPVAGILITPYPCVVLRDGTRCVEGAQVGGFVLVRIEADRLTFGQGSRMFVWEP